MGGYTQPYARNRDINAVELGLNGVTLAADRTSNAFSTSEVAQIVTSVEFTHGAGATTSFTFYFEESDDGGTTWYRSQASAVSSGTETLSDHIVSKAATGDVNVKHRMGLDGADLMRVVFPSEEAADIITVNIRLRNI